MKLNAMENEFVHTSSIWFWVRTTFSSFKGVEAAAMSAMIVNLGRVLENVTREEVDGVHRRRSRATCNLLVRKPLHPIMSPRGEVEIQEEL